MKAKWEVPELNSQN